MVLLNVLSIGLFRRFIVMLDGEFIRQIGGIMMVLILMKMILTSSVHPA